MNMYLNYDLDRISFSVYIFIFTLNFSCFFLNSITNSYYEKDSLILKQQKTKK